MEFRNNMTTPGIIWHYPILDPVTKARPLDYKKCGNLCGGAGGYSTTDKTVVNCPKCKEMIRK